MSYVKNEKIRNCPICGFKPKRIREHRSWVYCSNPDCLMYYAGFHYTGWNESTEKVQDKVSNVRKTWVTMYQKSQEEIKEYSESSEYWYEAYVETIKESDKLREELKEKLKEEKKRKKNIFYKLFG